MKLKNKKLIEINDFVPALEQNQEGLLRGGFSVSTLMPLEECEDINTNCHGCNVCNDFCTTEKPTTETTVTVSIPDPDVILPSSMLF